MILSRNEPPSSTPDKQLLPPERKTCSFPLEILQVFIFFPEIKVAGFNYSVKWFQRLTANIFSRKDSRSSKVIGRGCEKSSRIAVFNSVLM